MKRKVGPVKTARDQSTGSDPVLEKYRLQYLNGEDCKMLSKIL
jgi:hypothetical protein